MLNPIQRISFSFLRRLMYAKLPNACKLVTFLAFEHIFTLCVGPLSSKYNNIITALVYSVNKYAYIIRLMGNKQIKCVGRIPIGVFQKYNGVNCVSLVWHIQRQMYLSRGVCWHSSETNPGKFR